MKPGRHSLDRPLENTARTTIRDTLKRERGQNINYSLPTSGRPPTLTDTRQLIRDMKANPGKPWDFFAERFDVSEGSVKNAAEKQRFLRKGSTSE